MLEQFETERSFFIVSSLGWLRDDVRWQIRNEECTRAHRYKLISILCKIGLEKHHRTPFGHCRWRRLHGRKICYWHFPENLLNFNINRIVIVTMIYERVIRHFTSRNVLSPCWIVPHWTSCPIWACNVNAWWGERASKRRIIGHWIWHSMSGHFILGYHLNACCLVLFTAKICHTFSLRCNFLTP